VVSPRPTSLASGETWWLTEIWEKPARLQASSTMISWIGILPGVHQHHGDGIDAVGAGPGEFRLERFEIDAADRLAVGHGALVDLDDAFVELFGQDDFLGENIRPCLVGDAERVAEAPGDDQSGAVALALKQRIGCNRGAHLDVADAFCRDGGVLVDAEQVADALDGGIGIGFGVFRQELALVQRAVGRTANHIGEGAATVDPEIPNACHDDASRDCVSPILPWTPKLVCV
jgi:hypothetical protein